VDHVARLSGGEIALLRVLPELSRHVDVTVILGEDGPLVTRLQAVGVAVEVMPLQTALRDLRKESVRPESLNLPALASLPGYIVRLRTRIRALHADIVHTNSLKAALYGGLAGRLAGVPVVWHVRDRISDDYLPSAAVRLVQLGSRLLPRVVLANSRETMRTIPRWRGDAPYRIIVPDAVDALDGAERRSASASPVIGIIGRLAPWKGQDVFLAAFAQAFCGTEVRARVVGSALFGEDGYASALRTRAEALGIAEQVEFRGFREDIWAELRELDVLVHCSIKPEPFGQVVLEGLAAGVPVVAAAAGGPAELITSGVDGILVTPGDSEGLATELRRLVADPGLRARLSSAGRERSREFAPERAVASLLKIYGQVARGGSARRRPRAGES
jgi:glycosyltransferase involved in cell wall biosynthesis